MPASFKVTYNKILFIVVCIIDCVFLYMTYHSNLFLWYIFVPVSIPIMAFFKYYHFLVCYKTINRKNVNYALMSIGVSLLYKLCYFGLLFLAGRLFSMLIMGAVGFVDFVINMYFAANIYFMKSLLYFDVNIPVDGYGIDEKVNQFGNAIPGL
ncbi:hypothetical protein VCUG_02201 [Vavraia culicis subsp. floridensis]|uniref:Uncharacterized protein n=1 Tax=Vavraia culicis (isolate floridensis) TaxID=948595 RepID=L2GSP3_VAVCU|nr:uncharacterized protein VCUG_02201 [Vavraia culicis subsp. floridensis]ELA46313.1 hypothetical protein VCUG_02201 [Vavraia culicis subsp. floridensis]